MSYTCELDFNIASSCLGFWLVCSAQAMVITLELSCGSWSAIYACIHYGLEYWLAYHAGHSEKAWPAAPSWQWLCYHHWFHRALVLPFAHGPTSATHRPGLCREAPLKGWPWLEWFYGVPSLLTKVCTCSALWTMLALPISNRLPYYFAFPNEVPFSHRKQKLCSMLLGVLLLAVATFLLPDLSASAHSSLLL